MFKSIHSILNDILLVNGQNVLNAILRILLIALCVLFDILGT